VSVGTPCSLPPFKLLGTHLLFLGKLLEPHYSLLQGKKVPALTGDRTLL
jgi:hypothetical protein